MPIRPRQNWLKPHLRGMRCDLTDEEDAARARLLSDTINDDRYPLLARIRLLKRIRPERSPAALPPIRHREIHRTYMRETHSLTKNHCSMRRLNLAPSLGNGFCYAKPVAAFDPGQGVPPVHPGAFVWRRLTVIRLFDHR